MCVDEQILRFMGATALNGCHFCNIVGETVENSVRYFSARRFLSQGHKRRKLTYASAHAPRHEVQDAPEMKTHEMVLKAVSLHTHDIACQ